MAKHHKPKADTKRHAKDPFSTSELFKKAGIESQRIEKINQKKFAKEKANKAAKDMADNMTNNRKQRKVKQKEHPLAAAFSDTVEESREHIQSSANADIDAAAAGLTERLAESDQHFSVLENDALQANEALVQSFKDQELEWVSAENNRSGKTVLSVRMKKFQKMIENEEKELARQLDEWNKNKAELDDMVLEFFGPEGLKSIGNGVFEFDTILSEEQKEFKKEIEAEKKAFMDWVDKESASSMKQMQESEKTFQLKQKKIEKDFMALLADEEY